MTKNSPLKNIVFYADDDPDDLQLVKEAFEKYAKDVEVITAQDGEEALSILNRLTPLDPLPCLIILDVNMPRLNGKETLKMIRSKEIFKDIPIVLFTTSSLPLDSSFAQYYNAGFITKPLTMRQMDVITDQFISHCADEVRKKLGR